MSVNNAPRPELKYKCKCGAESLFKEWFNPNVTWCSHCSKDICRDCFYKKEHYDDLKNYSRQLLNFR